MRSDGGQCSAVQVQNSGNNQMGLESAQRKTRLVLVRDEFSLYVFLVSFCFVSQCFALRLTAALGTVVANTSDKVTPVLTYLGPLLRVEHRPSTTARQSPLRWAVAAAELQLYPCCFSWASVSRLQLLRGRPLFLFPCGVDFMKFIISAGVTGLVKFRL